MGRKIYQFLKSKMGIAVIVLFGFTCAYIMIRIWKPRRKKQTDTRSQIYVNETPEIKVDENLPELKTPKKKRAEKTPERTVKKKVHYKLKIPPVVILPINLYTAPVSKNMINPFNYAPSKRFIKCELVMTVDSSRLDTPITGIVIEDVVHNQSVIIPAGTEVHGKAAGGNMRDRIASDGSWTFIWRTRTPENGFELTVKGIALDMEQSPNGENWGITDGSSGLKGRVIDNTDWASLMAVAASFVSGIGEGMAQQIYTTDGTTSEYAYGGTFRDALGKGLEKAANLYAQQMLRTITRDGVFVRVPAGKQFYLYVEEPINLDNAKIGGTSVKNSNLSVSGNRRTSGRRRRL